MDDSKIIELFFARNEDAIKHTDNTYGRRLFHLADNIVRNDQDAEESVSDTYMKAWDTIPPKKPVHLFAYLAKICRNFALTKLDWKAAAVMPRSWPLHRKWKPASQIHPGTRKWKRGSLAGFWTHSCGRCLTKTRWYSCAGTGM